MTAQPFLPYCRQEIEDDDIAAVIGALKGDFITTGPSVSAFEKALAKATDSEYAVVCNSATSALHLAAAALGLGPGDLVVVPSVTFLATANAARFVGADVIFADVDPHTGLMTADTLEAAVARAGKPPKAVFPVHLTGWSCDMGALGAIAARDNLAVVEDAAHALGGTQQTGSDEIRKTGSCVRSDMTVFSFHPAKTITMGEGGAITTNDANLASRLRMFRSHGMTRDASEFVRRDLAFDANRLNAPNPWYYEMQELGWNFRVSDINCALGLSQLNKLERIVVRREQIAGLYDELFALHAPLIQPVPHAEGRSGWHLYSVHIDFEAAGTTRARVMEALREEHGIGTQVHYVPVHLQPYYRGLYGDVELRGARKYYETTLSLPFFAAMTDDDARRAASAIIGVLGLSGDGT